MKTINSWLLIQTDEEDKIYTLTASYNILQYKSHGVNIVIIHQQPIINNLLGSFFLLLNIRDDILKNVGKQTVSGNQ